MKRFFMLGLFAVFAASAQASTLDRKMDALIADLAVQYRKVNTDMVAKAPVSVLNLQNRGKDAKINYIGEALTSILKISVKNSLVFFPVDRENLSGIVREMELSQTGLLDENSSAKFNGLQGVDCLIVGEVTESGDNFIVACQLIDVGTAKILAASKTEIDKKSMIKETEKFAYEYISANGIGITFGFLKMILDMPEYRNPGNGPGNTQSPIHASLNYRLLKYLKLSLVFNNYAMDTVDGSKDLVDTLRDAQNIAYVTSITNYHYWDHGVVSAGWAGLDMQPNYYMKPELKTFGFLANFVLPIGKRMSIALGAGPQWTWVQYKQHCSSVPRLVSGAIEYTTVDIVNRAYASGIFGNFEFEAFVLPRLAVNIGLNYAHMFRLEPDDWATVNGAIFYKGTPAMAGGYGSLPNEYFGLDPFKTFNGNDVYVNVNNLQCFFSVSLYF
jgi:TolB-like protein